MNNTIRFTDLRKSRKTEMIWLISAVILISGCGPKYHTTFMPVTSYPYADFCVDKYVNQPLQIPDDVIQLLEDKKQPKNQAVLDAMVKKAGLTIAHHAKSVRDCEQAFVKGEKLFHSHLSDYRKGLSSKGDFKASNDPNFLAIQKRITDMWREDQSARTGMIRLGTKDASGHKFWADRLSVLHVINVDMRSTAYIRSLLNDYDWIDNKRFGHKVSAHAWILIQHADDYPDLQEKVLKRMEKYLNNGGIKPANYAYLWDRVAVNKGRLQRYGTQPIWECKDGQLELQPMENPSEVNQRRAEMGLNSVEEGLSQMSQSTCMSQ